MSRRRFFILLEESFQAFLTPVILRQFRGREAGPGEAPEVYEILAGLEAAKSLGNIRVFVAASASANAFVVGDSRSGWILGITRGVFDILNPEEFEALFDTLALRARRGFCGRQIVAALWILLTQRLYAGFISFWSFSSGGRRPLPLWKKSRHIAGNSWKASFFFENLFNLNGRAFPGIFSEPEAAGDQTALLSALKKMTVRLCDKPLKGFPSWLAPFWLLGPKPGPCLWRHLAVLETRSRNKTLSE